MELATIKELLEKIQAGEIDESKLRIVLDNDIIGDDEIERIEIEETGGYYDIEPLYKLLFPKAQVEWC